MFKCISASATDVGTIRLVNEDCLLDQASQGLWLVADGMGGHFAGDYASQAIVKYFAEAQFDLDDLISSIDQIDDILTEVNAHLLQYARLNNKKIVGSTLVLLLLRAELAVCVWVGDSRLYRYRKGQLECVTTDHSLVQEMVSRGEISADDAKRHPARNVITRAVGSEAYVKSDVRIFYPEENDTYLLCSDGLYNTVPIERIQRVLEKNDVGSAVDRLLIDALRFGADDNVSLIGVNINAID